MKTQIELTKTIIQRMKTILECEHETHKIERIQKPIKKMETMSTLTKDELKSIFTTTQDDLLFIISFVLFTELDFSIISRHEFLSSFELHKHLIFIK